jgi:GTP cyclohydrolase I
VSTGARADVEDVQNQVDLRGVHVDQAGIRDVQYPITILDAGGDPQQMVATATLAVGVPHYVRGTHMSRLVEVLDRHAHAISRAGISAMLDDLCSRLDAASALVDLRFVHSVRRAAPSTGASAYATFECWYVGRVEGSHREVTIGVRVPVTTLCPCSKAISDYGAHNQRGLVTLEVVLVAAEASDAPALSTHIGVAEASASAPLYPLVKRPDERHITMQAYDNPVFVEDIVRGCSLALRCQAGIRRFRVEATNLESIHSHNAFAAVGWTETTHPAKGDGHSWHFTSDLHRTHHVREADVVRRSVAEDRVRVDVGVLDKTFSL